MKKTYWFLVLIVLIMSCSKDETFPKVFTLHHTDQTTEGHYVVTSSTQVSALPLNIGTYHDFIGELKAEVIDFFTLNFNLKEVTLLSEDSLELHFFIDEEEFYQTLGYEEVQGQLNIDSLNGAFITYEKDEDQFVMCGVATFVIPGPNAVQSGPPYNEYNVTDCLKDYSTQDYGLKILEDEELEQLDTIGVMITRLTYR